MPRYIEIEDPLDTLNARDRERLLRAFERSPDDFSRWFIRPGTSTRAVNAALPILRRMQAATRGLPESVIPKPPSLSDLRVWAAYQQKGCTFDALAWNDSPVKRHLGGRNMATRRLQAIRAVRRVERFKRVAPPWWFRVVLKALED